MARETVRPDGASRPGEALHPGRPASRAGTTSIELVVAAATGTALTLAALALVAGGNRAVAALAGHQAEWQDARAAAALWAAEWRGAGYDPTGAAAAGVGPLAPDTMEFAADWNGDGALLPTSENPNERLAYAAAAGSWRRGVNGGPRLAIAWLDPPRFAFRDSAGALLPERPAAGTARLAVAAVRLRGLAADVRTPVEFAAARRNP